MALGSLLLPRVLRGRELDQSEGGDSSLLRNLPHFAPKAKRVIYLFQSGGPSHIDLFDYKPSMRDLHGRRE